ncbi:MAG TPA: ABC transporter ATP-binding protein [Candidatus Dormibacteraeota bacterium]|nr:ABC transporter ATP-binding protein [Candidatus Dormibacteraeota bacterium]
MTVAAGSEIVIEARGLTKHYGGGIVAVSNLDLAVRRGEVYGFLGPNGAGKTTTLRVLVGLIRPTAGTALVLGQRPGAEAALARVGSLVESPAFYPYLSGRDNLRVVARYCGVPESRAAAVLEEVGLTSRARDRFGTYSLGMRQRLGVAAALLKEPEVLILDEPSNGLDPQGMVEIRELVRSVGRGARTVLLSSHLLGEVEQVCDRVGVIQAGRLVAEGTMDELRGRGGLVLRAAPPDRARALLADLVGADAISEREGAFVLRTGPERAAEINARLVLAGLDVSEVRPEERSLEQVFLQLTGGERDIGRQPAGPAEPDGPAEPAEPAEQSAP